MTFRGANSHEHSRRETLRAAERFLDEEEVDSGIVVGRGNDVAFWHLTFQEFLAARAIASRLEPRRDDYWVTIPAGKFRMGAQMENPGQPNYDPEADSDESPVHEVYLDAYRIARYPVTVGLYQRFVDDDGYSENRWWTAGGFGEFATPGSWEEQLQYPSRPVVEVSWFEAAAFAAWAGHRLPTEAEWERAARGTTGRKFPWGDEDIDASRANFAPDWKPNVGYRTPVGIYPTGSTPDGSCDMAGNVLEWCQDAKRQYTTAAVANPVGPSEAGLRVVRGGSWGDDARNCRAAYRDWGGPQNRYDFQGFRLAAVPQAKFLPRSGPSQAEPGAQAEPAHAERSGAEPDRAEADTPG